MSSQRQEGGLRGIVDEEFSCLNAILRPLSSRDPSASAGEPISLETLEQFLSEQLSAIESSGKGQPDPRGFTEVNVAPVLGAASFGGPLQEIECASPFTTFLVPQHAAVSSGRWMYEAVLSTDGVMQIGWAAPALFNIEMGVGDFLHTYAVDGKRLQRWSVNSAPYGQPWTVGDVIGCCIDLDAGEISFYRNGVPLGMAFAGVNRTLSYRAGFSGTLRERLLFNTGALPLLYPVAGFAPLQAPPRAETLASAKYLSGCLRRLLLHSGCTSCTLSPDDVAITAAQLLDRLSPLLCSSPYIVAAELCPLLADLAEKGTSDAPGRLLELMESILQGDELQTVVRPALAYCCALWKSTSLSQLLPAEAVQPTRPDGSANFESSISPTAALTVASVLIKSSCCHEVLKSEYGFLIIESLLHQKTPTLFDRRDLMPIVWWSSSNFPEPEENRMKARETVRNLEKACAVREVAQAKLLKGLQEADLLENWLIALLFKNKDYAKSVRPAGLSDPSFLVSVFYVLLRYLQDSLEKADPLQWNHSVLYDQSLLYDVPRLGGAFTHLLKEMPPPENLKSASVAPELDRLFDLLARLFSASVGVQLQVIINDLSSTATMLRALEETMAQAQPQIPAYARFVATARAELSDVIRRSMWNQVHILPQEKLMMLASAVDFFSNLIYHLGDHDPALSYVPQSYTDLIFDSFHTFRRFELPVLDMSCSRAFAKLTARYISDKRIKNPDIKDIFLQSTFSLLATPKFVKLFELSPDVRAKLIPSLIELFSDRYWIEVSRILLCFWSGDLFLSDDSSSPIELQQEFIKWARGNVEGFESFVGRVLSNLNSTLSEMVPAMEGMMGAGRRQDAKKRVEVMMDLSVILLRLLEALTIDLPDLILEHEINRIRLCELIVFVLNRCTFGQDAELFNSICQQFGNEFDKREILAPFSKLLSNAFSNSESALVRSSCETLYRTPGFTVETVESLNEFVKIMAERSKDKARFQSEVDSFCKLSVYFKQLSVTCKSTQPESGDDDEDDDTLCEICCSLPKDVVFSPCKHVSCHVCIQRQMTTNDKTCFFCKQPIEAITPLVSQSTTPPASSPSAQ